MEDDTILHGLAREVWEETGLRIKTVREMVWDRNKEDRQKVLETGDDGEVKFQDRRGGCEFYCLYTSDNRTKLILKRLV